MGLQIPGESEAMPPGEASKLMLGPPAIGALSPLFWRFWEGSRTKADYTPKKKGTRTLTCLLEDLGCLFSALETYAAQSNGAKWPARE